jgi:hypothetical protein
LLIFLEDCPTTSLRGTKQSKGQSSKKIEPKVEPNQPTLGKLQSWFCTGLVEMDKNQIFFFQMKSIEKKRLILQKVENLLSSLKFFVLLVFCCSRARKKVCSCG